MFSKFKEEKLFLAITVILVALVVVLALLNLNTGFKLRNFDVLQGNKESADIYKQTFSLYFNRPILAGQNLDSLITIEPPQKLYFSSIGSELLIQPSLNLQSNTDYKIKIDSEFKDIFNSNIGNTLELSFKTRPLDLYYTTRNGDVTSLIKRNIANNSEETIVSLQDLVKFSIGQDFVSLINRLNFDEQELVILKTDNQEQVRPLPPEYSVYDFQFVPNQPFAYFTARTATQDAEYGTIYSTRKLYLLNLQDFSFEQVSIPEQIEDLEELIISPDGQALMYRDTAESIYYLMDVTDPQSPVSLGRFVSASGFNFNSKLLMFTTADFLNSSGEAHTVTIDSERAVEVVQPDTVANIDAEWANTTNAIVLAKKYAELENTKGLFQLELIIDNQIARSIRVDNESLELPKVSPDDSYIVAEKYTQDNLQNLENIRSIGYQAKPGFGKLVVIDAVTWQILTEIDGLNASWY